MVVPKIGTQFVLKKIADEVLAPPPKPEEETEAQPAQPVAAAIPVPVERDELDGQLISDEDGITVGRARRVPGVAVYIVSDNFSALGSDLEECVLDDESRRYFVRDEEGRLTGLIYAPHPDRMPKSTGALRAEDI